VHTHPLGQHREEVRTKTEERKRRRRRREKEEAEEILDFGY